MDDKRIFNGWTVRVVVGTAGSILVGMSAALTLDFVARANRDHDQLVVNKRDLEIIDRRIEKTELELHRISELAAERGKTIPQAMDDAREALRVAREARELAVRALNRR